MLKHRKPVRLTVYGLEHVQDIDLDIWPHLGKEVGTRRVSRYPLAKKEDGPVRAAYEGTSQGHSPNKA